MKARGIFLCLLRSFLFNMYIYNKSTFVCLKSNHSGADEHPTRRNILVHLLKSGVKMRNLALEKLIILQSNSFFSWNSFLVKSEGRHGLMCHAASKKYKDLDRHALRKTRFKQKANMKNTAVLKKKKLH